MMNLPIDCLFPELDYLPNLISISEYELESLISVASEWADEFLHTQLKIQIDEENLHPILVKDFLQNGSISESEILYFYSENQLKELNTKVSRNLLLLLNSLDDQGYQCFVEKLDADDYFAKWKLSCNVWFKGERYGAISSVFTTNYSCSGVRYFGDRDNDNKCQIQIKKL